MEITGFNSAAILLPTATNFRLLDKPYENEVTLAGQNLPLKYCEPLEILTQFLKG